MDKPGKWMRPNPFWLFSLALCIWISWDADIILGQPDFLQNADRIDPLVLVPSPPTLPSPNGALLRSTTFPGWGQYYNRKPVKGVILLLLEAGLLTGLLLEREAPPSSGLTAAGGRLLSGLIGVHIYGMMDAYVDAHLADFDTPDVFGRRRWDKPTTMVGFRVTW